MDDHILRKNLHCKDIIRKARKDKNFLKMIVNGDETWCFQHDSKFAEWRPLKEGNQKKSFLKSQESNQC